MQMYGFILNDLEYVQVDGLWEESPEVLWIRSCVTASE